MLVISAAYLLIDRGGFQICDLDFGAVLKCKQLRGPVIGCVLVIDGYSDNGRTHGSEAAGASGNA